MQGAFSPHTQVVVMDWLSILAGASQDAMYIYGSQHGSDALQAMVLTDCRDQLDSYGLDTALQYLDNKLNENAIRKLLAGNTMFAEVVPQT